MGIYAFFKMKFLFLKKLLNWSFQNTKNIKSNKLIALFIAFKTLKYFILVYKIINL